MALYSSVTEEYMDMWSGREGGGAYPNIFVGYT
jgi:hypothetical protein